MSSSSPVADRMLTRAKVRRRGNDPTGGWGAVSPPPRKWREAQEASLAAAAASTGAIRLDDLHPFGSGKDDERLNKAAPRRHKKKTSALKKDQRDGKTEADHHRRPPPSRRGRARGKGSRQMGDVQMADGEGKDVEMMAEEENGMLSTKAKMPTRQAAVQPRRPAKAEVEEADIHEAALIYRDEDEEPLHKRKKNKKSVARAASRDAYGDVDMDVGKGMATTHSPGERRRTEVAAKVPWFLEMSDDETAAALQLVDEGHEKGESLTVAKVSGALVLGCDIVCLEDLAWLNDEIVDIVFALAEMWLRAQAAEGKGVPKVWIPNSFFWQFLSNPRATGFNYDYQKVRRSSTKRRPSPLSVNVFELDYLLVPINEGYATTGAGYQGTHWALGVVDTNLPQQTNGYDCGVFVLLYGISIICNSSFSDIDAHRCAAYAPRLTGDHTTDQNNLISIVRQKLIVSIRDQSLPLEWGSQRGQPQGQSASAQPMDTAAKATSPEPSPGLRSRTACYSCLPG
ncbi:unnamed protein product [Vitrella brassicaformis CCMP3155]|uniref:Ubiquitin-like protease family profile domain-containing protein n=1 Tax=Vitrella brassicaformis (strain CCMP3155) TaxID=1169540 RepID=A0A0G4FT09_VITBC|nr:unnamed protein product [Vitrella brassicaformis CCMP3155]|eukprot:CEM17808.1 unnamed protein product [Vitrella brassicaformis CCMP3155]